MAAKDRSQWLLGHVTERLDRAGAARVGFRELNRDLLARAAIVEEAQRARPDAAEVVRGVL